MSPINVQRILKGIIQGREIQETLSQIEQRGSQVEYISVDVTDARTVQESVAAAERRLGKITGIVHGVGHLADKLIEHKTERDFAAVYTPKIQGLESLLSCVDARQLDGLGLKDAIIVRGRNLYPQDLEETACRCHPLILPGGAVAFSVSDPVVRGEEQIAVIAEIRANKPSSEQLHEIVRLIRSHLLQEHQVSCRTVAIAPPGTILKTTSGKLRRQACKQAYLKGTLQEQAFQIDTIAYQETTSSDKQEDPRLRGMTPEFHKLISNLALLTGQRWKDLKRRSTHTVGVTGFGQAEFLPQPNIPAHPFFVPGKKFPVIVRHAAGKGFEDDAIMDVRSATFRIVDGSPDAKWEELDLNKTLLDVIMNTGHNFPWPHAQCFFRWFNSSMPERLKMTEEYPSIIPNFQYIARNAESCTKLHYFNKMTVWFIGNDGKRRFMRYRLRNADMSPDSGFINPADMPPPMDHVPRKENDTRSRTYLRDDFQQRVENGGVDYLLQIQLREVEGGRVGGVKRSRQGNDHRLG